METYVTIFAIFGLIALITLTIAGLVLLVRFFWKRKIALAIYLDSEDSFANGELIFNLINAGHHKEIFDAHEDDIKLYAEGREIDAVFRKSSLLHQGFKIFITEKTIKNKLAYLSIMEAQKFNGFYIGIKNHAFHAQYITDSEAKRIAQTHLKKNKNMIQDLRGEMIDEMQSTYKKALSQNAMHDLISHVSTKKSKQTSFRYQLLFPDNNDMYKQYAPENKDFGIYHVYNGKAYKLDFKYIGKYGTMIEYDIINLEPNSIYVGISVSKDGGKTILPSASIYGKTRDENDELPTKTRAKLAKPKEGAKEYPFWNRDLAIEYVGEMVFNSSCDTIIKKHYEDKDGEKLPINEAHKKFDEIMGDWFK